jgi:hypothetical protein
VGSNFRGWPVSKVFADVGDHAHYTLYNRTYFAGLIFTDNRLSAKTTKIKPHENFPLYGSSYLNVKSESYIMYVYMFRLETIRQDNLILTRRYPCRCHYAEE